MGGLPVFLARRKGSRKFFPLCDRGKAIEVQERVAVERGARDAHDPTQADEGLFIDLVSAEQVEVIAEVPQEPVELPQGLLSAIEPSRDCLAGMFFGLEDGQAQGEERLLRVPAMEHSFDPDQEDPFYIVVIVRGLLMESRDVAFHDFASLCWA